MSSTFYSEGNLKEWYDADLKDFGSYAEKVRYKNQRSCGECDKGDWFYADDETLTIYHGTYGNYNAPGCGYTYADVFDDKEEYRDAVKEWEGKDDHDEDDFFDEDEDSIFDDDEDSSDMDAKD